MKDFLVLINCKYDEFDIINNKLIVANEPIQELRRQFPEFTIRRGNGGNWNIMLWHQDTDTHLYYVARRK